MLSVSSKTASNKQTYLLKLFFIWILWDFLFFQNDRQSKFVNIASKIMPQAFLTNKIVFRRPIWKDHFPLFKSLIYFDLQPLYASYTCSLIMSSTTLNAIPNQESLLSSIPRNWKLLHKLNRWIKWILCLL